MHFDLDIARGLVTVCWFVLFIALSLSAWSRRRRAEFDAAARLPFDGEND
jgi:cbb3-type cytochrome oxidase subunit 3